LALRSILLNPSSFFNRGIFVCGVKDVTQNALLASLESVLSEASFEAVKFDVTHVDVKKIKEDALKKLAEGDARGAVRGLTINSNFNEEDSRANFWDRAVKDNELLGIKVLSVTEGVKETLKSAGNI
jgi:hypothetical protein